MANAAWGMALRQIRGLFEGGNTAGSTDEQLLSRYAKSRDGAAFEALVARHGPMVAATCRAVLRNEHDAEDAFQATFLILARKAATLRSGEALGGWLHRVAYRSAVQASVEARRRRKEESEAIAMATPDAIRAETEPDLRPVLHEEIDRLPDRLRLPIILCDVEGLTYEEASSRLGWTEPTLRCRLSKARQRLRGRLTRRGITATLLVAILRPTAVRASVPDSWSKAVVASATGGAASAGASLISQAVLRGMFMTKLKIVASASLALSALTATAVVAVARMERTSGPPAPNPPLLIAEAPKPEPRTVAAPRRDEPRTKAEEAIEVRGRVVSPDGKPVPDATVRLGDTFGGEERLPETRSGADGRFLLRLPQAIRDETPPEFRDRFPYLVASASGFAPGWVGGALRSEAPAENQITLADAGPPVEGRIVDLEGRPVAGVRVAFDKLLYRDEGNLSPWIKQARQGAVQGMWRELQTMDGVPIAPVVTGPDGRFTIPGPGRDRLASLVVSGPTVATATLYVLGRDEPEIRTIDKSWAEPRALVIHGPRFDHAAAPTKVVEGMIRDKDTGKPIAGIIVRGNIRSETDHTWIDGIESITDAEGRYRLGGLPKAPGYFLFLFAKEGIPYTNGFFSVPAATPALEPVPFDITLKRGVVVRGRLTDKVTGEPVVGSVAAYTYEDNPFAREFSGYRESYFSRTSSDKDGRFQVVTLPGHGILAARADDSRYRGGIGAEAIPGLTKDMGGPGSFRTQPEYCHVGDYHALLEVTFDASAETATRDLQVDSGRTLTIKAVDADGKPVGDIRVMGLGDNHPTPRDRREATVEIRALDPSRPRRVTIWQDARKLVGSVYLRGDETGTREVQLRPWGQIVGRLVDDDGRPRSAIHIFNIGGIGVGPSEDRAYFPPPKSNGYLQTDGDGRFRVEGLIPGLKYGGYAADGSRGLGDLFENITVAPGETKDLGDLQVRPNRKEE